MSERVSGVVSVYGHKEELVYQFVAEFYLDATGIVSDPVSFVAPVTFQPSRFEVKGSFIEGVSDIIPDTSSVGSGYRIVEGQQVNLGGLHIRPQGNRHESGHIPRALPPGDQS